MDRSKWMIHRERARIDDWKPPSDFKDAVSIGNVVSNLIRRFGLGDKQWLMELSEEWPNIVGEAIAKHTKPGRFMEKKLVVFVDSSIWLSELSRYGRDEILAKIQKRFGQDKITELALQLNPDG